MSPYIVLLALAQAILQSANIHLTTTGSLVALALTQNESLSTWPASVSVGVMLLMTIPASLIMARYGRKAGFVGAIVVGTLGAFATVIGITEQSFAWFIGGAALMGATLAFANFLRFAAVELVGSEWRARSISYVLTGGVVAAIVGPYLSKWGYTLVPQHGFAGGYLLLLPLFALALILLLFVRFRPPTTKPAAVRNSLRHLFQSRRFLTLVFLGAGAYVVMAMIMTATPLAMHHHHLGFEATTEVIRSHILGMFVPSFFTGHLIHRFGVRRIVISGAILYGVCILINFQPPSYWTFMSALILLGIGWNFLFVSASQLLTTLVEPEHQSAAQALNDFVIAGGTAAAIAMTGALHHFAGWQVLNLWSAPLVALLAVAGYSLGKQRPTNKAA